MKNAFKLAALLAGALLAGNTSAGVVTTLLEEDFENVKRVTTNPNTNGTPLVATTVRTVENILDITSNQLDHSGTSGYWVRNAPSPASESAFNVRAANNAIDGTGSITAVLDDEEFDNFFDSQFLVIGDNGGNLGGDPNGISGGLTQTLSFNFGSLSSFDSLNISFKYVFDAFRNVATTNPNPDDFSVSLTDGANSTFLSGLNFSAPATSTRNANYSTTISLASLSFAPTTLKFSLTEFNGNGSSAVGLDNLLVQAVAVPEPASLALFGASLVGLGLIRRRKT